MKIKDFDGWYIGDCEMFTTLDNFFIRIFGIFDESSIITYKLSIYCDSKEILTLDFDSFREAVLFTEEEIKKSSTVDEIISAYDKQFKQHVRVLK